MIVKELKKILENVDDNLEVVSYCGDIVVEVSKVESARVEKYFDVKSNIKTAFILSDYKEEN